MKVVRRDDAGANGICQNPELASNFANSHAPANCANVWSTAGSGCLSLFTLSLSFDKSTQMRTLPLALGMTTKGSGIVTWNDAVVFRLAPSLAVGGLSLAGGCDSEDRPSVAMIPTLPPCSNVVYGSYVEPV